MSIKKITTGLALSMMLSSGVAVATDGNKLLEECQSVVNYMNDDSTFNPDFSRGMAFGTCFGIAEGVRNTMTMYSLVGTQDSPFRVCFPDDNIRNDQATRIITSYLKKNPSDLHKNGSALAMLAFLEAFPCK